MVERRDVRRGRAEEIWWDKTGDLSALWRLVPSLINIFIFNVTLQSLDTVSAAAPKTEMCSVCVERYEVNNVRLFQRHVLMISCTYLWRVINKIYNSPDSFVIFSKPNLCISHSQSVQMAHQRPITLSTRFGAMPPGTCCKLKAQPQSRGALPQRHHQGAVSRHRRWSMTAQGGWDETWSLKWLRHSRGVF